MGEVLIKGMLSLKIPKSSVLFSGRDPQKVRPVQRKYKIRSLENQELVKTCDVIFIGVKPQDFKTWKPFEVHKRKLVVSVMAGISVQKLKRVFPGCTIVRAMPNLGGQVGESMTAWFTKNKLTTSEKVSIKKYLGSFGQEMELKKEDDINKFTTLMANGPAYLYLLMHLLEEKAVEFGFPAPESRRMVKQLIQGAFGFLKESDLSPAELIQKVASKGGTTEAALQYLKQKKWDRIFQAALEQGYKRAKKLSR